MSEARKIFSALIFVGLCATLYLTQNCGSGLEGVTSQEVARSDEAGDALFQNNKGCPPSNLNSAPEQVSRLGDLRVQVSIAAAKNEASQRLSPGVTATRAIEGTIQINTDRGGFAAGAGNRRSSSFIASARPSVVCGNSARVTFRINGCSFTTLPVRFGGCDVGAAPPTPGPSSSPPPGLPPGRVVLPGANPAPRPVPPSPPSGGPGFADPRLPPGIFCPVQNCGSIPKVAEPMEELLKIVSREKIASCCPHLNCDQDHLVSNRLVRENQLTCKNANPIDLKKFQSDLVNTNGIGQLLNLSRFQGPKGRPLTTSQTRFDNFLFFKKFADEVKRNRGLGPYIGGYGAGSLSFFFCIHDIDPCDFFRFIARDRRFYQPGGACVPPVHCENCRRFPLKPTGQGGTGGGNYLGFFGCGNFACFRNGSCDEFGLCKPGQDRFCRDFIKDEEIPRPGQNCTDDRLCR